MHSQQWQNVIPVRVLVHPHVHGLPEVLVVLVEDADEPQALRDAVAASQEGYEQAEVAAACGMVGYLVFIGEHWCSYRMSHSPSEWVGFAFGFSIGGQIWHRQIR